MTACIRVPASRLSPEQLPAFPVEKVFLEYLVYDAKDSHLAVDFVNDYPWLLEDATVCTKIISDPDCYNTLKVSGLWERALADVPEQERCDMWLKSKNALALAYDTSTEQLQDQVCWSAWEILVEQDGAHHSHSADPDLFYRTRALMALANRLGTNLAPLMCAALHVWLPLDDLNTLTTQWSPLQKAQYAWFYEQSGGANDTWPAQPALRAALTQNYASVIAQYKSLVPPEELGNLPILLDLNNGDLNDTLGDLIQLTKSRVEVSTESLDYTIAVDSFDPP